jgi:hypothetical protein
MGFEPTISAGERPHTHALDGTATGRDKISLGLADKLIAYKSHFFCNVEDFTVQQLL